MKVDQACGACTRGFIDGKVCGACYGAGRVIVDFDISPKYRPGPIRIPASAVTTRTVERAPVRIPASAVTTRTVDRVPVRIPASAVKRTDFGADSRDPE